MSGPKYSTAYIRNLHKLQQLAKELADQIEKSKKEQILADIARLEREKAYLFTNDLIKECENIIPEAEDLLSGSIIFNQFKKTLEEIKKLKDKECKKDGNSEMLSQYYQDFQRDVQKSKNLIKMLKELRTQLSVEGTDALQKKKEKEFLSMSWDDAEEKISTIPVDLLTLYYEVLDLLSGLSGYEEYKDIIDKTIMSTGDFNYQRKQLEMRKAAIIVEQKSTQDNIKILSLKIELQSLYRLLGYDAKELPVDQKELEEAISEAKQILEQKQKSEYIAKSIHEVFKEKGYELVDDSIITNKKGSVEKDYYTFGDDSLVNVSMSDRGQILFEVVGNTAFAEIDGSFASKMESEMRRFCPDYGEIKDTLMKKYGISLENEHLCEPDKMYARSVNITKKDTRRKKKTEKKMMYYDDRS